MRGSLSPPSVLLDVFPPLQKVRMAVRPILDGLIHRLTVVHRSIDGSDVRERYIDARQNFTGLRVFFRKALVPDPVVALRRRINALRILEELHIELLDHPGWLPDGCNNPLIAVDRRLQRCRHCCRTALHKLELEAVILHGFRRVAHQAGTRLDPDDPAAELVRILIQLINRVDSDVFWYREALEETVRHRRDLFQPVLVLVPVILGDIVRLRACLTMEYFE